MTNYLTPVPVVTPTYPSPSLSMNINLGISGNTVRRNLRNYAINIGGIQGQRVDDHTIILQPNDVWLSNPNETLEGLVVQSNQPIELTISNPAGVVSNVSVNSFFATDTPIVTAKLVNTGSLQAVVFVSTVTEEVGTNNTSTTINYYGSLADPGIYNAALIDQLLPGGPGISNIFTANPATNQYIWYAYPTSLGLAQFLVNGFVGGFTLMTTTANLSGVNYTIYRSDNSNLGQTSVSVS